MKNPNPKYDYQKNCSSFKQLQHSSDILTAEMTFDWLKEEQFSGEPICNLNFLLEFYFSSSNFNIKSGAEPCLKSNVCFQVPFQIKIH